MQLHQLLLAAFATTAIAAPTLVERTCTPQGNGGGDTENGVVNQNCCTDVTVIFARGTSEFGNVGTFAGPPFFAALRSMLGANRVTVQGVNYPASLTGLLTLGAAGAPTMAADIKQALAQCPNTKIVASGYSQGAEVVHNAFSAQGLSTTQVSAALLFGDPFNTNPVGNLPANDLKEICAPGDLICETDNLIVTPAHLSYALFANEAASWVVSTLGL